MSLVAYGSSDESGDSDTEDSSHVIINSKCTEIAEKLSVSKGPVSEATDSATAETTNANNVNGEPPAVTTTTAPLTNAATGNDTHSVHNDVHTDSVDGVNALLHGLPAPKGFDSGIIENDELEDEVKPKSTQVADIRKPTKKKRQPVRIHIPELRDDSDDDDEPAVKKQRPPPSAGKSGLTALLPPPVHAAKKESNRILLPYTLTKKQKPANTNPPVSKKPQTGASSNLDKMAKLRSSNSYDSDSDDGEPVSFFSLESTGNSLTSRGNTSATAEKHDSFDTESSVPTVPLPPQMPRTQLTLPNPISRADNSQCEPAVLPVKRSKSCISDEGEVSPAISQKPSVNFDAPLTFKGGVSSKKPESASHTQNCAATDVYPSGLTEGEDQNMYYNKKYEEISSYVEATDDQALQQDDSFLRIQGKTRRGREDIQITDVVADDFTTPEVLAKSISEEQQYQSHRKKDNMPSGQQKRKHQITYLAFQAKETELELKNQWADNRMSKKQTQAKYGF